MPPAVLALTAGAFGTTEFIIMGLLLQVAAGIAAIGLMLTLWSLRRDQPQAAVVACPAE